LNENGPAPVKVEFRCVACGYNIRGMSVDALCPECGTPIFQSLKGLPTSGFAIASLVLGIVAILGCGGYGIPALVCGPLAIYFARRARRQIVAGIASPHSAGLARAGFTCGLIGLTLGAVFFFVVLGVFVLPLILP